MPPEARAILVVAISGRALAASAARAGRPVVVLDCFADRDTSDVAPVCRAVASPVGLRLDRRRLFAAAAALAPAEDSAGLVYGSGFEGRAGWIRRLAEGRQLHGNAPAVVAGVRRPSAFFALLDRLGIPHPEVRYTAPADLTGWLVKEAGGAGGTRVRHADRRPLAAGAYLQRLAPGRSCSVLFLADGQRACVLGFSEQWTSPARSGLPFLYGGAVGPIALPARVDAELRPRLDALVAATGLIGLNGMDFLLDDAEWSVLEVNPRPTATMDLYDPDYPLGLFDAHLRACAGELPGAAAPARVARASTILHARQPWQVTGSLAFPPWCRDIPRPGTTFEPGDPVCTVYAEAGDCAAAVALVREREELTRRALIAEAAGAGAV